MTPALDVRRVLQVVGLLLVAVVVVPIAITAVPQLVLADHSYVVTSGSMEPAMSPGDVVVVGSVPAADVRAGDVITFRDRRSALTTHRVVGVETSDGERRFRTKGDANEDPDPAPVPAESVVGEVRFTIPYVGHFVLFMNSRAGLLGLVIVPAVLLAASELWDLAAAVRAGSGDETDGRPGER